MSIRRIVDALPEAPLNKPPTAAAPLRPPHAAQCATHFGPDLVEKAVYVAANAMFLTDRAGRIGWVNHAFTRLYGYSPCEVLGRTPDVLKSGDHTDAFYRNLWSTLEAGKIWRGHLSNRHRDGGLLDVDQTITPVCDDRGEVTNYFVVCEDILRHLDDERPLPPRAAHPSELDATAPGPR